MANSTEVNFVVFYTVNGWEIFPPGTKESNAERQKPLLAQYEWTGPHRSYANVDPTRSEFLEVYSEWIWRDRLSVARVWRNRITCACNHDYARFAVAGSESYKCANRCPRCQGLGVVFDLDYWRRTGETLTDPCDCPIGRMDLADDVAETIVA